MLYSSDVRARDSARASLGCELLSVRGEAANRVTSNCWYQRRCVGVGVAGGVRTASLNDEP
jgi:hypothetical protein